MTNTVIDSSQTEKKLKSRKKLTLQSFIEKAHSVHNFYYDYSRVSFNSSRDNVLIICPQHGAFKQRVSHHLYGSGCPQCALQKKQQTFAMGKEQFISKANEIHGNDMYDYSLVDYKNNITKVKIICNKCGLIFEQTPQKHIQRSHGCPYCRASHGENWIKKFFSENNIMFEYQKRFSDLQYKSSLSYDFYVPSHNLLIEYNGKQHYEPVRFGGVAQEVAEFNYKEQLKKDSLKKNYAFKNGYRLLSISYKDNLEQILKKEFNISIV